MDMTTAPSVIGLEATKPAASLGGKTEGSRRPMNAFLLFCKRHRAIVKEVYPNLENRHITKILGEFWSSLSQEEKLPFNDLAATYKDHLMREQPAGGQSRGKSGGSLLQPSSKLAAQPQIALDHEVKPEVVKSAGNSGQGSSGSSSPEPGSSGSSSSSAPKPFKKRYLAAEKAKNAESTTMASAAERKTACEALLKLAEGSQPSMLEKNSKESVGGPTNGNVKSNPYDKVKESAQFTVLRQAVWTRVAKTILTQEEEKGKLSNKHDDKPINLSSQCLIPNSTIIEHIIENIINDNDDVVESAKATNDNAEVKSECSSEQIKEKIYQSLKEDITRRTVKDGSSDLTALWKMLPNPMGGSGLSSSSTKKNGLQTQETGSSVAGMKKAHSAPASQSGSGAPSPKGAGGQQAHEPQPAVSVTLVTTESDLPLNLSKTPPQTPASGSAGTAPVASSSSLSSGSIAITITTSSSPAKRKLLDDDLDDDLRRSSGACKGRRYQEFKDAVGHRRAGRGGAGGNAAGGKMYMAGKSDGESSHHSEDEMVPNSRPHPGASANKAAEAKALMTGPPTSSFDLEKALMNIPALRPEEFQRRIQRQRSSQLSSPRQSEPTAMETTPSGLATGPEQVTNTGGSGRRRPARPPSESTLVMSAHGH